MIWLIEAIACFVFGVCIHRLVWPRVRFHFYYWSRYTTNYVRYVLPMDLWIVWPLLYRSFKRVF